MTLTSDNYFFLLILPVFLLAKNLMLSQDYFHVGWSMAVGLFRMAFLVMLERTLTQFMKGVFNVSILNHPGLNKAIKILGLLLVFESLMPPQLSAGSRCCSRCCLLGRFFFLDTTTGHAAPRYRIMYLVTLQSSHNC